MKKLKIVGLALFVVFAFSALTASAALAVSQWLVEGATLGAAAKAETEGTLTLVKFAGKTGASGVLTSVECKGILDGTIGAGAKDTVTAVLNLAQELVGEGLTGKALECEVKFDAGAVTDCMAGSVALVWVLNLNGGPWTWETEITLEAGVFLDTLGKSSRGAAFWPGYEVECKSLLGLSGVEECENEGPTKSMLSNAATTPASVLGEFIVPGGATELASCSMTGAESGALEGSGNTWGIGNNALERLVTAVSDV